jgi:hypothetical protein
VKRQLAYLIGVVCGSTLLLSSCGGTFDYPKQPPVPPDAKVVASASGSDDDDPMRGRELVVDIGAADAQKLLQFYRERFPQSAGWADETPDDTSDDSLCLVNRESSDYDEFMEFIPYRGTSRYAGPGRFLVWTSRLHTRSNPNQSPKNRCGFSLIWFPIAP